MEPRIIKTSEEYEAALAEVERLVGLDPEPGCADGDRLEVLALLVEEYEQRHFKTANASPIDAIAFRMEQQGLCARDLVPFLGTRGRVSEVMSGRRDLTLPMIRALNQHLGVPAESLLSCPTKVAPERWDDVSRFPLREMIRRKWISDPVDAGRSAEELVHEFFAPLGAGSPLTALYRRTTTERSARRMDPYCLLAWRARVLSEAEAPSRNMRPFNGNLQPTLVRDVVRLSASDSGPLAVAGKLAEYGIVFVVEPHLPKTWLDGAAMTGSDGRPVIGVTLRHDRIDAFWFCVAHELAHVILHLRDGATSFVDDLEPGPDVSPLEAEADELAGESLVPTSIWRRSRACLQGSPEAVTELAASLGVSPAIVAGRVRFERRNYRILGQMVGTGRVRGLFSGISWTESKP